MTDNSGATEWTNSLLVAKFVTRTGSATQWPNSKFMNLQMTPHW